MPHIQQSTSATVNNNNNRFLAKVMQDSAKGSTAVSAHRRARQPSRRLCPRDKDWSGTGRSRLLVSTPSRRRSITPRTGLEDERHREGISREPERSPRENKGRRQDGEGTRSTNATINWVYDVTVDSLARARQKEVTVRRRCSWCCTRGTMQPGHYGKHGRLLRVEEPQFFPPARRRRLRGLLLPHGQLQSRLSRYRWTRRSVGFGGRRHVSIPDECVEEI